VSGTLRKAMLILEALRETETDLSARELAVRLDLPKSTTQRLLQSLEESRMAVQDPATRKYRLGPRTLTLGMAYRERLSLRNAALPHMRALRDAVGETVGLSVAVGEERMFIEEVQSQSELRARSELGYPYALWTGAPGRVLLADLPADERDRVLAAAGPAAWEIADPPTREGFARLVESVGQAGYARAFDESIAGVSAVSVPVLDASRRAAAALSVSGPTSRMSEETMAAILPGVRTAAAAISRELGG